MISMNLLPSNGSVTTGEPRLPATIQPGLQFIGRRPRCLTNFRYSILGTADNGIVFLPHLSTEKKMLLDQGENVDLLLDKELSVLSVTPQANNDSSQTNSTYYFSEIRESWPSHLTSLLGFKPSLSRPHSALESQSSLDDLEQMRSIVKDSIIRKQGMEILLNHLEPFLERLALVKGSKERRLLSTKLLDGFRDGVLHDISALERFDSLLVKAQNDLSKGNSILKELHPPYLTLTELSFEHCKQHLDGNRMLAYIRSLKKLERPLCINYNRLLLYSVFMGKSL